MFRQGIIRLVSSREDIEIIAETDNGDDFVALVEAHRPEIGLVDISMPGPGAPAIVEIVDEMAAPCKLIALTMHLETGYADELLEAIHIMASGDSYLSKQLVNSGDHFSELTSRELDCLKAAAKGKTSNMIATDFDISEPTVRFHLTNVCRKLGVQRRSQAVELAWERDIFSNPRSNL